LIIFKSVKWRNFLSTGDKFTTVRLDKSPTTLIVGQNGAGKSTLLDALSFGLFGKPHRDIKKDQLVNSINKKRCEVEVEFHVGNVDFRIYRSIKPGKFEIYQSGKLVNQASSVKDYQKYLEQNILKLNHKSFHQVVVLGSSSFIPFMALRAGERREVIEDLLDINIFTKMKGLLKERQTRTNEQIQSLTHQIELLNTKIDAQKKYITNIELMNADQIDQKQENIESSRTEIEVLISESTKLGENLDELLTSEESNLNSNQIKVAELNTFDNQFNKKAKDLVKQSRFYEENNECPTCDQEICQDTKHSKVSEIKDSAQEIQLAKQGLAKELNKLTNLNGTIQSKLAKLKESQSSILANNQRVSLLQEQIGRTQEEISILSNQSDDMSEAQGDYDELRNDKSDTLERKLKQLEDRAYNDALGEMLKDTGIKTKVIKQYLPVMNQLVNQYLQVLDFFVAFNLDESFNETIKSRHRDMFNYSSFSEGEKQRIDLSLLFTWRKIAQMKNSANTNLLILDETFDSSLDVEGVENLTKILATLEDGSNVFIISHKGDILENKFRSKIEFVKDQNFSRLK
tara:strand:+ start:876 stop:2591 length:1716 start_codon:yes stop_codon:yes gene_type:complete